eukprot:Opistho-1_new@79634
MEGFRKLAKPRNIRRRVAEGDADDVSEVDGTSGPATPSAASAPTAASDASSGPSVANSRPSSAVDKGLSGKRSAPSKRSLLSFGEEEDGEGGDDGQMRAAQKKALSRGGRRAPSMGDIDVVAGKPSHTQMSAAGEYTAEKLAELRRSTTGAFYVRETQKPVAEPAAPRQSDVSAEALAATLMEGVSKSRGVKELEGDVSDDDGRGAAARADAIPDAAMIHAARKRREMARQLDEEFIPISKSTRDKSSEGSRLIREDENDRSDEDDNLLTGGSAAPHADLELDADMDDEVSRWERDQIRKGNARAYAPTAFVPSAEQRVEGAYAATIAQGGLSGAGDRALLDKSAASAFAMDGGLAAAEVLRSKVRASLSRLRETHSTATSQIEKVGSSLADAREAAKKLEVQVAEAAERYEFFQEMRAYVSDLLACLDEKVPTIEQLESDVRSCYSAAADAVVRRRQQWRADYQLELLSSVQSGGFGDPAEKAARQQRLAEVEQRRQHRRARLGESAFASEGGWSTDEESEGDAEREQSRIAHAAAVVFDDAVDEVSSLAVVRSRFENWKRRYPDTYNDAFIGLSVPRVFASFARLEMITWHPLKAGIDFEQMGWFTQLLDYGNPTNASDPDYAVIPAVVERVVVPHCEWAFASAYDPMSLAQTRRAVDLVQKLHQYETARKGSDAEKRMTAAISGRLQRAVDSEIGVAVLTPDVAAAFPAHASMFTSRLLWSCAKLYASVVHWSAVLPRETIEALAVSSILLRHLLPALKQADDPLASLDKIARIIEATPADWLRQGHKDSRPLLDIMKPLLRGLCVRIRLMGGQAGPQGLRSALGLLLCVDDRAEVEKLAREWSVSL